MSDTSSKATKAQNLARIRDNQRRSRARRKEYLQELEAKLRNCEQTGIEASAEIQSAARRVLEENKRLRAMLRTRGVPETEIAAFLGTDKSYEQSSAAPALNSMLDRRWACNMMTPDASNLDAQSDSASHVSQTPSELTSLTIPQQQSVPHSTHEAQSPVSIISSTEDPSSYSSGGFFPVEIAAPVPEIKTESDVQYNYFVDQNPNNAWAFPSDPNYGMDPAAYYNASSCVNAANIIRTMRTTDMGSDLEVDLGCRTYGQDCRVTNQTVFNVMEKYSHAAIRM